MSIRFISGIAATLLCFGITLAQVPAPVVEPQPELTLKPVPPILRLHLPILGENLGVLVESVSRGSAPENAGIRAGDVLLEAGGSAVRTGDPLDPLDASLPIVVLRRGRTQLLHPRHRTPNVYGRPFPAFDAPPAMSNRDFGPIPGGGVSVSSSSTSSSFGDRAVSISRAGEQISLEISMPDLADGPIRLHGTAEEIEHQLQTSELAETAKREVRAALQQAR